MHRDILFSIALELPVRDLKAFFSLSKLHASTSNDYFWSLRLKRDYNTTSNENSYSLYKRYYRFKSGKSRTITVYPPFCQSPSVLEVALKEGARRGDTIVIDGSDTIYLFDGKQLVEKYEDYTSSRIINHNFLAIEEFSPDYWFDDDNSNFCFDPRPYLDQIEKNKFIDYAGWCQSSFVSWNGIKYDISYTPDIPLNRIMSWYFRPYLDGDEVNKFHLIYYGVSWST